MDNIVLVQSINCQAALQEVNEGLSLAQAPALLYIVEECPTRGELQHQIDYFIILKHVLQTQDVLVLEFPLDVNFPF